MGHSLVRTYVHYVWSTKNRERLLDEDARRRTRRHIAEYAGTNGIALEALDVQPEHVHALVRLFHDQRIEDVSKLLKGESSHWINQNDIIPRKFSWQTGYAAFSVDHKGVDVVKEYILNQDAHHKRKSWTEEVQNMLREAGYPDEEIAGMLAM